MAELYYVREGVINSYALDFIVPVPANFTFIYFTWHSLIKRPVSTAGGASRSALNILSVWLFVCFEKLGVSLKPWVLFPGCRKERGIYQFVNSMFVFCFVGICFVYYICFIFISHEISMM